MPLNQKKEILSRFNLIINSMVFMISAYLFLVDGKMIFAGIIFFTGVFYLVAIRLMPVSKGATELGLFILNMIVALITSLDFFRRGSHYIQYVWLGITLVYLIFSIRQYIIWQKFRSSALPETENK